MQPYPKDISRRFPWLGVAALALALLVQLAFTAMASSEAVETTPSAGWKYDPANAQEILETCAACHGKRGAGGSDGEYPRISGLDERYIIRQLEAFKTRERANIPMYPYATERELPDDDVRDIARLLSQIELPTKMPDLPEGASAYQQLLAAQSVFTVPRVDGDVARGATLYEDECADCHGEEGWGEDAVPQLAGQHTNYLRRQIEGFRSGERRNEDMTEVLESLADDDLEHIWAYLASRDD